MSYKNIKIKPKITEARLGQRITKPLGLKPRPMSLAEKAEVLFRIQNEGFDYCFRSYSNFDGVKDPEFQRRRKEYVKAANQLETYLHGGFTRDQLDSIENEESPFEDEVEAPDVYGRG